MSDINVISRTQHIDVNPASSSVSIISTGQTGPTGAPGPAHPSGVPEISGISVRGTISMSIPPAGTGASLILDPISGIIQQIGSDVELVSAGGATHQIRALTAGLYHVNAYVRANEGGVPAGSFLGIRRNGQCIKRSMLVPTAWASVSVSVEVNLLVNDLISMFAYSTGFSWVAVAGVQSTIDPPCPMLEVWHIAAGPKGDPGV